MKGHRFHGEQVTLTTARAECECNWFEATPRGCEERAHDEHLASLKVPAGQQTLEMVA